MFTLRSQFCVGICYACVIGAVSVVGFLGVTTATMHLAAESAEKLQPANSVVDYLKSKNRESTIDARSKLFREKWPDEKYSGSAEQNLKLLDALLMDDIEATAASESAKAALEKAAEKNKPGKAERHVEKTQTMRRYTLAEGFGVNGTYVVKVRVAVSGERVRDKNFDVSVDSASAQLGDLTFSGTVDLFVGDSKEPKQHFNLEKAWFPTVGPAGATTVWRYATMGTTIVVPPKTKVVAKVTVRPVVNTTAGSVALGVGMVEVPLSK